MGSIFCEAARGCSVSRQSGSSKTREEATAVVLGSGLLGREVGETQLGLDYILRIEKSRFAAALSVRVRKREGPRTTPWVLVREFG